MFFLFFLNQIELKPPLTQSVTRFFLYLVFLNLTSKRPFFSNISRLIAPYGGLFRDCLASLSLAIKINYHLRLRNDLYCTLNSCSLSITWKNTRLNCAKWGNTERSISKHRLHFPVFLPIPFWIISWII